ncbi:MAG: nucleotide-binding universal stress UspA family protein [Chlamydiales bacterium]|jgi:nucleotide-binding universal stress UspA family protein
MKPMHILLTTDLSDEALRAFQPASQLASQLGARVTLLHVMRDAAVPLRASPAEAAICLPDLATERKHAEKLLVKQALSLPTDLDVTTQVVAGGDVAETVTTYAEEQHADLVVLSTHGHSGVQRLVMGSVAEAVVRNAQVPVLSIPPADEDGAKPAAIQKQILLTADLSDDGFRSYEPVLALATKLGSTLTALHVVPETRATPHGAPFAPRVPEADLPRQMAEAHAALQDRCTPLGDDRSVRAEVISSEKPARAIVDFARDDGTSIIAITTHARKGLRRLALGSVAAAVLRQSSIPVLSIHRS